MIFLHSLVNAKKKYKTKYFTDILSNDAITKSCDSVRGKAGTVRGH